MKKRSFTLTLVALSLLAASLCPAAASVPPKTASQREWTLLVNASTDNNLEIRRPTAPKKPRVVTRMERGLPERSKQPTFIETLKAFVTKLKKFMSYQETK